ncbi:MAG: UbiX family flavin prenyltransferase [Congregibacter sp.]
MRKIVVGISGASGIVMGLRALQMLREAGVESHLVMSKSAELTLHHELDMSVDELKSHADHVYPVKNVGATIASGSFITDGMLIAPCSVRTMSEIASGVTSSLLTRAADVVLKERRRLVLMVRETPLHTGHLRTMTSLSEMGAVIAPPVPAFYTGVTSLDESVTQSVGRALDLFGISETSIKRWQG